MRDVQPVQLAGGQFNRIARWQLLELGLSDAAVDHRVESGRLVIVEEGVFATPPVLHHDEWGVWMGATLTEPGSVLSRLSAAAAWGLWDLKRPHETITRPGNGGPRKHGRIWVHRSTTLDGDVTYLKGIPLTTPLRTILDLACSISGRALARMYRDAFRLKLVTLPEVGDALGRYRGRRGCARVAGVAANYADLPLERARSGAEIRGMEIQNEANRVMPELNIRVAGEEADLVWRKERLIIEIDGGPFHQDKGEDKRKQEKWEKAGYTVRRIPDADVYERPWLYLALSPDTPNVPRSGS